LTSSSVPCRQIEDRPVQPVRGDADEALALLSLAVGEVIRHPPLDVRPLPIEIALGLEDGAADQGVEPPAHLRHPALEIERVQLDAEFLDQQLAEIRLYFVVAGAVGEMADKVLRCLR